jgi:hypothetical protein
MREVARRLREVPHGPLRALGFLSILGKFAEIDINPQPKQLASAGIVGLG